MGAWRPLNLELPPFSLPPPIRLIRERRRELGDPHHDKSLGVWAAEDVLRCVDVPIDADVGDAFLFVHIPKTAGTSFRVAVSETFHGRCLYDYSVASPQTSALVRKLVYEKGDVTGLRSVLVPGGPVLVAGHVPFRKYSVLFPPTRVITFVREPVVRVVSEYEHLRRHGQQVGELMEFAAASRFRNVQTKMLAGLELSEAALVGVTERYGDSLRLLRRRVGWAISEVEANVNPRQGGVGMSYGVGSDVVHAIRAWNAEDVELYRRACESLDTAVDGVSRGAWY